jgi:hypothetical protein
MPAPIELLGYNIRKIRNTMDNNAGFLIKSKDYSYILNAYRITYSGIEGLQKN